MKFIIAATFLLLGSAFAQVPVSVITEWSQNDQSSAGAIISLVYQGLKDGTCFVQLPNAVNMFHVMNGHIIPDGSDPEYGFYKITAPADWEAMNGTFNALIIFNRDKVFSFAGVSFTCNPEDVEYVSVYSFPNNNQAKEASSSVYYRWGFHKGDVLTITFPVRVARFELTTMDGRYSVTSDNSKTFTLSGFQNEEGDDSMKEVGFNIEYLQSEYGISGWFSAGDISVSIVRVTALQ
ncbi:uncharacterized protein LOC120342768 isoform X2 [Styela clava]